MSTLIAFALSAAVLCQGAAGMQQGGSPSPFDLAELVDSGTPIDWNAMWAKFGRVDKPPVLLHCGDPHYAACSTELIVIPNPHQLLLLLQTGIPPATDFYFRFIKQGDDWKFAGYHAAFLRYYPRRHQMLRFANKPFLEISVQGESGTGLASEIAEWFDLTLPSFEPVFSYPVQGHRSMLNVEISRDLHGSAEQDRRSSTEAIRLSLFVVFSFEEPHDLGEVNFVGVYERRAGEARFSLQRASLYRDYSTTPTLIPLADFEKMQEMFEGPSIEKLLTYVMPGLKKIATGKDAESKGDLKALLDRCRSTPERLELERLLSAK